MSVSALSIGLATYQPQSFSPAISIPETPPVATAADSDHDGDTERPGADTDAGLDILA